MALVGLDYHFVGDVICRRRARLGHGFLCDPAVSSVTMSALHADTTIPGPAGQVPYADLQTPTRGASTRPRSGAAHIFLCMTVTAVVPQREAVACPIAGAGFFHREDQKTARSQRRAAAAMTGRKSPK